jgi:hypothetical protein
MLWTLSGKIRDPPFPFPQFIDLGEPRSRELRAPRALTAGDTDGPHRVETARCARVRDHYGTTSEGPRRPVTSSPHVVHYTRGSAA